MDKMRCWEAVPDNVWHLVLRALYQDTVIVRDAEEAPPTRSSISALALACASLRDMVRRVRAQARYQLAAGAASGCACAEHLNRHGACTSVHIITNEAMPLAELAAFQCHISSSASRQVTSLTMSNDYPCNLDNEEQSWLDACAVLLAAKALPGLRELAIHSFVIQTEGSRLFTSLAAACPQLCALKVRLSAFCPHTVAGLSTLRNLISLELEEHCYPEDDAPAEGHAYPGALMQQMAALTKLTHLSLSLGVCYRRNICCIETLVIPALAPLSLRSLELLGHVGLSMEDFPVLAEAQPFLEHLEVCLYGQSHLQSCTQVACWHMPGLKSLKAPPAEWESNRLEAAEVLQLADSCPALQCLPSRLNVYIDMSRGSDAGTVRRWVQGLSALAAAGRLLHTVLPGVLLKVQSAAQADVLSAALKQLQPAEHRTALLQHFQRLEVYRGVDWDGSAGAEDAAALGRLVAHLPCLREVECNPLDTLPALAPLRSLRRVTVYAWRQGFARLRAEALRGDGGPADGSGVNGNAGAPCDADRLVVKVHLSWDGKGLKLMMPYGVVEEM